VKIFSSSKSLKDLTKTRVFSRGIVNGDWDSRVFPISALGIYNAMYQRAHLGMSWEETFLNPDVYKPAVPNEGSRHTDPDTFYERCRRLDDILISTRSGGQYIGKQPVGVVVNRAGDLIRNSSGLHRLIACKLYGIDNIPCKIIMSHKYAPLKFKVMSIL